MLFQKQSTPSQTSIAAALAETLADGGWESKARPNQLPPPGDWSIWLVLAGRGFGKTRTGAEWVCNLATTGAASRIALIAPTSGDCRDIMLEGSSGIMTISPDWNRPLYEPSKRRLTWPNGAQATLFSAEEADRLRGPNFQFAWCDELAAWADPQGVWDMLQFTMRIGKHPKICVTTTPRPIRLIKDLVKREGQDVAVVRGSTYENADNLSDQFIAAMKARYEGTRLGRQELFADVLSDVPGALWQQDWIDNNRIACPPFDGLARIVVAIDPAVTSGENADETGIIVAGIDHGGHAYILEDLSGKYQPHEWAAIAISAYRRHNADRIIAEKNNGGDLVENVVRSVDPNVSFKGVIASRGKVTRAEPISALYEQGKVHHTGTFTQLEDQLCAFTSDFNRSSSGYSPDRLDALVWALTELMLGKTETTFLFV
jgi:predicted phage terminase large subunit-like protein